MKIRKIRFENHPIFGELELDFTDKDGKTINTIIIAGENGVGKSQLLNTIFEFSNLTPSQKELKKEKRYFEIQLSDNEIERLKPNEIFSKYLHTDYHNNIFFILIDYNIKGWNQISINGNKKDGSTSLLEKTLFSHADTKAALRTIFSDVEINFTPNSIQNVTSTNIDRTDLASQRSSPNLATEITQLLIDIQNIDALEFTEWGRKNVGKPIDEEKIDVRTKRFTLAYDFMFPLKKYKKIENFDGQKHIIFEENGIEMPISQLSSGEKQIVFRGSFLLKDKESAMGALILIDEPEISLHPNWQLKILSFLKKLFTNTDGKQTSQIILTTHSPFIIHNVNRKDDKVIILQKDVKGKITIPKESKFFSWTTENIIQEAFNISNLLTENKMTVFLEGETDEKYYNKCLEVYGKTHLPIEFKWIGRINENGNAENSGDTALNQAKTFFTANMEQIKNKIVLFYDCDTKKPEENIGNLLIRKMNTNGENVIYKKGVENLLTMIQEVNVSDFYKENTRTDGYGAKSIIRELHKTNLCGFICDTLDVENQKIVLNKINDEIDRILIDL